MSLRPVPPGVLAGPVPRVAETAPPVKADVRTMGPPWELHDGDDAPLFTGQESEVKAQYHVMRRATSVLTGDLYVCDSAGARYVWNRQAFRWDAPVAQMEEAAP